MNHRIEMMPRADKDLKAIPKADARTIVEEIKSLSTDLSRDVKKLTNFFT